MTLRCKMKQEIINELNLKFAKRHSDAQNTAYAKVLRAQTNPEFVALEKKIKTLTFELGKAMAFGQNNCEKIKNQLTECKQQQTNILAVMKLSPADLLPQYSCKKCNDTGKINGRFCDCYKRELYSLLLEKSGAKTNLASFAQFDEKFIANPEQREQHKKVKKFFESWAQSYPNVDAHTFLICGKTGVGKTFMTECVANAMMQKGKFVSFVASTELNNIFLKYHIAPNNEKLMYWQMITEPDLLVIDDLGTEPLLKNVTINYLVALLNERFMSKKATIISTNLSPDQILSHYGDRIFSRIVNKSDSKLFNLVGDDLRLKKR